MNQGDSLHLVIIEKTGEKAEQHALALRDAGLSFQSDSVHDITGLQTQLELAPPDMVICGQGPGVPDLHSVNTLLNGRGCGIPLIALANDASEPTLTYDFASEVG